MVGCLGWWCTTAARRRFGVRIFLGKLLAHRLVELGLGPQLLQPGVLPLESVPIRARSRYLFVIACKMIQLHPLRPRSSHRYRAPVPISTDSEAVCERHLARLNELLPEYLKHVEWDAERLQRERTKRLRELISTAISRSSWHRQRLRGIDVDLFSEADLERLPVMTKTDLMENFDDIVTDPRLNRVICERHVESLSDDAYLLDEFHVVASGGSRGERGLFVYGWDAWAICYCSIIRFPLRDRAADPELSALVPVMATVAASKASHMSAAMSQTFSGPGLQHLFPVTQPIEQIVEGLNDLQPTGLKGYSSFLPRLAMEARAGRLRISPRRIVAISEPLLPETRVLLEETWGVPVASGYGMSEGLFTGACGYSAHLPDDLCMLETIGHDGARVAPGCTSEAVRNILAGRNADCRVWLCSG